MLSTTFSIKPLKTSESKVHEHLYDNILLLTKVYPTTKDFDAIFKHDMFVKNNKAAFHHVIYYLLGILNAELIKQKIRSWPIFEVRLESRFRAEVLVYINELNAMYENANIPPIMASHLITPGGYKFAKFMLKLSQFVLSQHLSKDVNIKSVLLYCGQPDKENRHNISTNLKNITKLIDSQTKERYKEFQEYHRNGIMAASRIQSKQLELNESLKTANLEYEEKKRIFNEKYSSESNITILEEKIRQYNEYMMQLDNFTSLYRESCKFVVMLNKSHILQHKTNLNVDGHVFIATEELSILELLSRFNESLRQRYQKLPNFNPNDIKNVIKSISKLVQKSSKCYQNLCQVEIVLNRQFHDGFQTPLLITSSETPSRTVIPQQADLPDEILAIPLEISIDSD